MTYNVNFSKSSLAAKIDEAPIYINQEGSTNPEITLQVQNGDLSLAGLYIINHNFSREVKDTGIYDNLGNKIITDEYNYTDQTYIIDFSAFTPLVGIYKVNLKF